jgi:hypothetical protein
MRVQLVDTSCHLQDVLERVEARLEQIELVMTSALILEGRLRDCESAVNWMVCQGFLSVSLS